MSRNALNMKAEILGLFSLKVLWHPAPHIPVHSIIPWLWPPPPPSPRNVLDHSLPPWNVTQRTSIHPPASLPSNFTAPRDPSAGPLKRPMSISTYSQPRFTPLTSPTPSPLHHPQGTFQIVQRLRPPPYVPVISPLPSPLPLPPRCSSFRGSEPPVERVITPEPPTPSRFTTRTSPPALSDRSDPSPQKRFRAQATSPHLDSRLWPSMERSRSSNPPPPPPSPKRT